MFVSIIIPCRNEEKYIANCLNSVLNSDYSSDLYEITVVDGMSNDNTVNIVLGFLEKNPQIKLINNPNLIVPISLNMAIKEAKGDMIIRLDAHAEYPENYISCLIEWKEKLNADNIGAICITEVMHKNSKSEAIKKVLTNKFGVGNSFFRLGVDEPLEVDTVPFGCYSKSIFEKVGLYDERLIRNQDIELNKRIKLHGGKIFLIPYTHCVYYAKETYSQIAQNNFQNGLWNMLTLFYTKTVKSLSIRHFIPLMFVGGIISALLISLLYLPFIFISIGIVTVYLISTTLISLKIKDNKTTFFHIFWAFIVLHFSYGFGSFIGMFNIHYLAGRR